MTRRTLWLLASVIAVAALAASASSLLNGYAYDDVGLILTSQRMHSMDGWLREFARSYWPGADGYRPLTIIGFRAQWVLGNGSATLFHAVNVALHVAGAIAVFWLARLMLPLAAAAIAAALYAVHPVHVEAIANVVGQSDLLVAVLLIPAVALYIRARAAGAVTPKQWVLIGLLYGAACLVKEHAIVLPALLLLAETTVVRDEAPVRARLARLRLPLLALTVVALGYLWARSAVLGGPSSGFNPYVVFSALDLSNTDRVLTMIGASPEWFRLFLWPARLMTQYAPPYIEIAQGPGLTQLPGLFLLLGTIGLAIACWRRSPATSFGIVWVIITLLPASNFILPAGFIIAERTLLLPSVGAMIALASALGPLYERIASIRPSRVAMTARLALGAAPMILIGLGIRHSDMRNRVWRDDLTLHQSGVVDSPDSYRAHFQLGFIYMNQGRYREGEMHYRKAIELFPHDPLLAYTFAEQLRVAGRCEAAIPLYRWLFEKQPDARLGHMGHAHCLLQRNEYEAARAETLLWLSRGGRISLGRELLASVKAARDSAQGHTP
jgi:hypothetical protein